MLRGSLCALLLLFYVLSAYAQRVVGVISVQSNAPVHSSSASHSHPVSTNFHASRSRAASDTLIAITTGLGLSLFHISMMSLEITVSDLLKT